MEKEEVQLLEASSPSTPPTLGRRLQHISSQAARGRSRGFSNTSRSNAAMIEVREEGVSLELSAQAEARFLALLDFISGASREAASLKEFWAKLTIERTAWAREREGLLARLEDANIVLVRYEETQAEHRRESAGHKKEIDRLLAELAVALAAVSEHKHKVTERDGDLERHLLELAELRLLLGRSKGDHGKLQGEFEALQVELRDLRSERDAHREELDKQRSEIQSFRREDAELKLRNKELTEKLDLALEEIATWNGRHRDWQRERGELFAEKEQIQLELRKSAHKAEESARTLAELIEEKAVLLREHNHLKDHLRKVEDERDAAVALVEKLRLELKEKRSRHDDLEAELAAITLKLEHATRDHTSKDERLAGLEAELARLRLRADARDEEVRVITGEREQLREELERKRHELTESSRHITKLQETLATRDSSLGDARSELLKTAETIALIELARDEFKDKHRNANNAITGLEEEIAKLKAEIRVLIEARDRNRKEADDYKYRFEEVSESVTVYEDQTGEFEFEIKNLRALLRESREQKEAAITARKTADHERDEALAKYEEKCREMESWEEGRSSFLLSHARRAESRVSTARTARVFSRGRSSTGHHEGERSHHVGGIETVLEKP